jgi:hypothetical protein
LEFTELVIVNKPVVSPSSRRKTISSAGDNCNNCPKKIEKIPIILITIMEIIEIMIINYIN